MNIKDLFSKVENAEQDFYKTEFVSPVVRHSKIRARILGLIHEFRVLEDFEGWAILKPERNIPKQYVGKYVRVVGSPNLLQINEYLHQFLPYRIILCERRKDGWYGLKKQERGDTDKKVVPVLLVEGVSLFDNIVARWDGINYWCEEIDRTSDPSIPEYLRDALNKSILTDKLSYRGLSPCHREAYQWQYFLREEHLEEVTLETIKKAVEHGTSKFLSYIERKDSYVVTFSLNGEEFRATIMKKGFEVISAGICLSGGDHKFDLQSLTSVIKEGQDRDLIYRED